MRVGVIGPIWSDSLAVNILRCLEDLGVTAVPLGPAGPASSGKSVEYVVEGLRRLGAEGEAFSQRPLTRRIRAANCDVIINILASLAPQTVRAAKETGSKICVWYPDAVSNVGRLSLVAADYDAIFLKDPLFADRLSRVYKLPAHYLPEACNPHWHKPTGNPHEDNHIAVVGAIYPTRARLLLQLHADGVPLKIYGGGFPRWFDPGPLAALHVNHSVHRLQKSRVFRQARGVLNNLHPAEMDSVNCRLFEATAAGGAVLCERRNALPELFDEGTEVLGFSSYDELLEHSRNLVSSPELGMEVGNAASVRSLSEHTFQIRLAKLLTIVS